jgi:RNA polymerase sigma factor (TIGR02999 family)
MIDRPNQASAGTPSSGDSTADLLSLVYEELRDLARHKMDGEQRGHSLQATALVHEAYLRLRSSGTTFANRAHFFHAAALAMQRILVEHARRRSRAKRGGGAAPISLNNVLDLAAIEDSAEILALDDAIRRLEELTPQAAAVLRLRFYAGLSVEETAEALSVSVRTVHREWAYARAWLYRELRVDNPGDPKH